MENYTIEECKSDMILLWGELARSGGVDKLEAASRISKIFRKKIDLMQCDCPCCEFTRGKPCVYCPIWGGDGDRCHETEYGHWGDYSTTKLDRQYWANKILIRAHMIKTK